jgi:hypothetical protein
MVKCKNCSNNGYYFDKENPVEKFCRSHKTDKMLDTRHCEHKRQKSKCKECGGASICEHKRQKSRCKDCGGSDICEHNRQKATCKDCGGSGICVHGHQKSKCKDCGGSGICVHGHQKSKCKDCGGSDICVHGRQKAQCVICTPSCACVNCRYTFVTKRTRFHPYCFNCYCVLNPDIEIPRKYKIKECHLRDALRGAFPTVVMRFDKVVDGGCSRKRPDVLIDDGFPIIIECDENRHSSYSCENKRTMELFKDLGSRPLRIIRFNPDGYKDENGVRHSSCFVQKKNGLSIIKKEWEYRISILSEILRDQLIKTPEKEVDIIHLFY